MVLSRHQANAAFTHVMDNVIGRDSNSGLGKALAGISIKDVFALCTSDSRTIVALVYDKSPTETGVPISKADKGLLTAFVIYVDYVQNSVIE